MLLTGAGLLVRSFTKLMSVPPGFDAQYALAMDVSLPDSKYSEPSAKTRLAQRMVDNLGSHYATFLRGHGVVVVGPGIEGTCISAIQLERACQDQLLMMSIGEVKPMADAGRGRSNARLENPYRAWPFLLWKHKVKSKAQIRAGIRTLKEGEHY